MFTVYLIKVVWEFGVETLVLALALIKCCWVAKYLEKLSYKTVMLQFFALWCTEIQIKIEEAIGF